MPFRKSTLLAEERYWPQRNKIGNCVSNPDSREMIGASDIKERKLTGLNF